MAVERRSDGAPALPHDMGRRTGVVENGVLTVAAADGTA